MTACLTDDNLALKRSASQISTWTDWVASRAVDGATDTVSCTGSDVHPWWSVDLGAAFSIGHVTVTNAFSYGNCRQTFFKRQTSVLFADINQFLTIISNKLQDAVWVPN